MTMSKLVNVLAMLNLNESITFTTEETEEPGKLMHCASLYQDDKVISGVSVDFGDVKTLEKLTINMIQKFKIKK